MSVVIVEGEGGAPDAAAPEAALEAAPAAAVEIAEIQADRDVTLAAIAAESERERAELWRNDHIVNLERELSECRNTISTQATELEEKTALLSTLQPLVVLEAPPSPTLEAPPSGESIPSEEPAQEALDAPPAEPAPRKRKLRLI